MTRSHCSLTLTCWPTADALGNRASAMPSPSTATAARSSRLVWRRRSGLRQMTEAGDRLVLGRDAEHDRHVAAGPRQQCRGREPLARRDGRDRRHVGLHEAHVVEREARRDRAHLVQRLPVGGLTRLDDQVAHAEVLDERHDLLLRAGADREHRRRPPRRRRSSPASSGATAACGRAGSRGPCAYRDRAATSRYACGDGREAGAFIAHLPRLAALLAPVHRLRPRRGRGARHSAPSCQSLDDDARLCPRRPP